MAALQPKNTTDIRVDNIDEKTASAGVILQTIMKFVKGATSQLIPQSATVDIGTSTAAQHVRKMYTKAVSSLGQALGISTESAHDIQINLNTLTCWTFTQASGALTGDATNGGDLIFSKAGKGVVHTVAATVTAAGTTQGGSLLLTSNVSVITTCSAGVADGVQLPTPTVGKPFWVANESGASAKVYGTTGVNIDDGAANAAFTLADNTHKMFMPITSTRYLSF